MTDDLARLGLALELAATRSVQRRRMRLQAIRGGAVAFLLAIVVGLGSMPGQLDPSTGPFPVVPVLVEKTLAPPALAFMVRHIPDEHSASQVQLPCLDGRDCPAPDVPSLEPAPPGRV
jgi:hypothetical protein